MMHGQKNIKLQSTVCCIYIYT